MSREAIYSALFARLSAIKGIKTASRRVKVFSDVPGQMQPALFQEQKGETVEQPGRGLPRKLKMLVWVWLYAKVDDHAAAPATTLNALVDAVELALAPDAQTGTCTLGGTVSHCWIAGKIETDDGAQDSQAIARIPVEILVP